MKMLVHRVSTVEAPPFDLATIKTHMRISFDDHDDVINNIGHAAAAEIEHFAQVAFLTQIIRVTIFDPALTSGLRLPVGPVAEDATITVTIDGEAFTGFAFAGGNRPYINWKRPWFDLNPTRVNIEYQAGFGATHEAIPHDLAQALMDQAALHYDGRSPMSAKELTMSPHMARIGARYRGVSA
ncbi:head-tail connector protein [Szabonella alba]|uniref:Phage head-tail connector protein n=1 Tax=Szabonella alba TaxID=2804194 RepID=A0A8K0VB57_9RHOB|nr:phage head-tail connector protein [Szabonella alba]MBL4917751.1 phage head-tail connector protein [Szabonella alba]